MQVNVLLSSGDEDEWIGCSDAVADDGALMVITKLPDSDPEEALWNLNNMKIVMISKEVDQGPDRPPATLSEAYKVDAVYAPGMWMKVEFSA
jgi:hypothetical protein